MRQESISFLNPDTVLRNNAIDILCRFMKDHPSVGACGGNLYDEREMRPLLLAVNIRLFYGSYWGSYIYLHYVFRLGVLCFSITKGNR